MNISENKLYIIVRTGFGLNPKQEWTQAQKAQTINLQRVGEEVSLNLGKRYWSIVLINRKKLQMYKYKKYPRSGPSSVIKSTKFFLFTIVFLQPFSLSLSLSLFFFFLVFFPSSSFDPFSCYILRFLRQFLHPRVSQVFRVSLSPFTLP